MAQGYAKTAQSRTSLLVVLSLIVASTTAGCTGNVKQSANVTAPSTHDTMTPGVDTSSPDASTPPVNDPGEHVNRKIFAFNVALDHAIFRPVARGYSHLPHPIRTGVHNVVQNLGEPGTFVNDALQGNVRRALDTAGRFAVNTTIGVVGIFDVANHWGMPHHHSDMGQTFGVWGLRSGRTVEMPIFGSSNVRDTFGFVLGHFVDPLAVFSANSSTVATVEGANTVGGIVDGRAEALPITDRMEKSSDYYEARRDFSAKRRQELVAEGKAGAIKASHDEDDENTTLHANP